MCCEGKDKVPPFVPSLAPSLHRLSKGPKNCTQLCFFMFFHLFLFLSSRPNQWIIQPKVLAEISVDLIDLHRRVESGSIVIVIIHAIYMAVWCFLCVGRGTSGDREPVGGDSEGERLRVRAIIGWCHAGMQPAGS